MTPRVALTFCAATRMLRRTRIVASPAWLVPHERTPGREGENISFQCDFSPSKFSTAYA